MEKRSFLHGRLKEGTIWKDNSIQSNGKKKKKGRSRISPIFDESRTSTDLSLPSIKSKTRIKKKKKRRLSNMSMNSNEVNLVSELGKRKEIKKSLIGNGNEDSSSSDNKSIMNLPNRKQLHTQSSENQSNSIISSMSTNKSTKKTKKKKKKKVLSRHSKFRKISAKSKTIKVGNYQKKVVFIGKVRNEEWFKRLLTPSSKIG